jgi:hypothetical protein
VRFVSFASFASVLVLVVCVGSRPAAADDTVTSSDPAYVLLTITDFMVVPPLVVNTVFVAQHKHKSGGAIVGFVTGAIGVGMGLVVALPTADHTKATFGWVTAGLGVADLGMALWVLLIPRHHYLTATSAGASWTIGPMVTDRGQIVPGATFSLLRF